MDVLSFAAGLVLGAGALVVGVLLGYLIANKPKCQEMVPRGGGGSGEEPGKK